MGSGVDIVVLGVDISVLVLNALGLSVDISVLVSNAPVIPSIMIQAPRMVAVRGPGDEWREGRVLLP